MNKRDPQYIVFGYGTQGKAQALNLRDSGKRVSLFLRPKSKSIQAARKDGLSIVTNATAAARLADVAVLLIPDGAQAAFWRRNLKPYLRPGATLIFAHGFALHYKEIVPRPDINVVLVAPMGTGKALRQAHLLKQEFPCLLAVAQNATKQARATALDYARAISPKGPFVWSTVAEEVETDLFSEQAVLCGGLTSLVRAGFETLVEKGYHPEIAYLCCVRELAGTAALLSEAGIDGMRRQISDTARYGDVTRGPRVIGKESRDQMRQILEEIRSGAFAEELRSKSESARLNFEKRRASAKLQLLEEMCRKFR